MNTRPTAPPERRRVRLIRSAVGSAVFFAAAPSVVAGLLPWSLTRWRATDNIAGGMMTRAVGAALTACGLVVLTSAFVRFVREGLGTPAPIAPTEHLVIGGLYRHVRNPMYLAVVAIIVGQGLVLGRAVLLTYAGGAAAAMASFAHFVEEPALARQFGVDFDEYRRAVRPWRPRLRGWEPPRGRSGLARD